MSAASDAKALFTPYKPTEETWAVQVTADNAALLAELDGIQYEPETDDAEMVLVARTESGLSMGLAFGDWLVSAGRPGLWSIYSPDEWGDTFQNQHEPYYSIDVDRTESTLRAFIADLDYDIHKNLESDEETGEDTYPQLAEQFAALYQADRA